MEVCTQSTPFLDAAWIKLAGEQLGEWRWLQVRPLASWPSDLEAFQAWPCSVPASPLPMSSFLSHTIVARLSDTRGE